MAFVVETGAGLSNANSYLSVIDADTYHTDHSDSADWSGASQSDKEQALRLATQCLDVKYNGRWKGYRSNEDQALDWPRSNVADADGYSYDSDKLPQRLEDAIAELALRVIEGDTLLDDIDEPGTIKSESSKVGPLAENITYMGGKSQDKAYPLINSLIRPLVASTDILERG